IEVTSPSTEAYDRGAKLEHYRSLSTLQAVVVLSHREARVDLISRNVDGAWTSAVFMAGTSFQIDSLGIVIVVDDLYENIA
ncbi:MAG TPA: Uma2 family endonuclease, partial [Kofleriaceae bacterium]|nr:Uma2 family endonuclease [Kofleriaceae bacterium]